MNAVVTWIKTRYALLGSIVGVAVLSILANGISFGFADHNFFLSNLYSYHDPALLADPFINALRHYPSLFIWLLGATISWYNVEFLVTFLHIITVFLAVAGTYFLALSLFKDRRFAILFSLLVTLSGSWLLLNGADTVVGSYLDQTGMAVPLLIFALGFFFRDRPLPAGLLIGISALVHVLFTGFVAAPMLCYYFAKKRWPDLAKFAIPSSVGAGIAVVSVVQNSFFRSSIDDVRKAVTSDFISVFGRLGSIDAVSGLQFIAFLALAFICFRVVFKKMERNDIRTKLKFLFAVWFLFLLVAFLGGDVRPSLFIMNFQLVRVVLWITLMAMLVIAYAAWLWMDESGEKRGAALALLVALLVWKPVFIFFALAYLIAVAYGQVSVKRQYLSGLLGVCFGFGAAIVFLAHPAGLDRMVSRINILLLPEILAVAWLAFPELVPFRYKRAVIAAVCAIALLVVADGVRQNHTASGGFFSRPLNPAWRDIQLKTAKATKPGDIILVPPYVDGFRVFSGRQPYFEIADFGAVQFYPPYTEEFYRHLQAFGYRLGDREFDVKKQWYALGAPGIDKLAGDEGIGYLVAETDHPVSAAWQKLDENGRFAVYKRIK